MRSFVFLLVILPLALRAQFVDDFSDGDFTANPTWTGDVGEFIVTGSLELRLNSSGTDTSFLVTDFSPNFSDTLTWEFRWRMNFAPSANNFGRIYLLSSGANLNGGLNGYFLHLGENGSADVLKLYRQDGTTETQIMTGTTVYATNPHINVRVTRLSDGQWMLEAAPVSGSYALEGTVTDATYSTSSHFGLWCKYTSTNATQFYFDDFKIDSVLVVPSYATATFRDVVINELMADPSPMVGLPEREFIELFNASDSTFDLNGWTISDGTTTTTLVSAAPFTPGDFVILCATADVALFSPYGTAIGLSLPSLNNAGDALTLKNNLGSLIDAVAYSDSWYGSATKAEGGFTLEQINPYAPCSGASNWTGSNDTLAGGTPGGQNSVFNPAPDTEPPTIVSVDVTGLTEITVTFSEDMDSASLAGGSFGLNNAISVNSVFVVAPNKATLSLSPAIDSAVVYTLTADNVSDCSGNFIQAKTFVFGIGVTPNARDVVITEIYPDPDESAAIPNAEFVEVFNRSGNAIRFEGVELADPTKSSAIAPTVLMPGEYAVLCSAANSAAFSAYGKVAAVSSMPALSNTSDSIFIHVGGKTLDLVAYSDAWYDDEEKAKGGWTLERINPEVWCIQQQNWRASTDPAGGTPGAQNSIHNTAPDTTRPVVEAVSIESLTALRVRFSKAMDSLSLANASYALSEGITITAGQPLAPDFREVRLVLAQPLDSGQRYTLTIGSADDCVGNPSLAGSHEIAIALAPGPFDIIINEIYPVPNAEAAIPPYEFVEILNRSGKVLNMDGLRLSDRTSGADFKNGGFLLPGECAIVCDDAYEGDFVAYGKVATVGTMPTLNNTDDEITLSLDGTIVDAVAYSDHWFGDKAKANSGYTLERISPNDLCGLAANWSASTDPSGGTPGRANSVYRTSTPAAPSLVAAQFLSLNEVALFFDRKMDSASLTGALATASNATLKHGNAGDNFASKTFLSAVPFERGRVYTFSLSPVEDCAGSTLAIASIALYLHDSGDVVINEVLSNPRGAGSDFVELHNHSAHAINLQDWSLAYRDTDDSLHFNAISTQPLVLPSGGYIALSEDNNDITLIYPDAPAGNLWEMDLPAYSNDEGSVLLYDALFAPMERFDYSREMHFALIENTDGVSLERLSPARPAADAGNWHSASSDAGYATPGRQNSQYLSTASTAMFSLSAEYISPDNDGYQDVVNIDYSLATPGIVASVSIYTDRGMLVRSLATNLVLGTSGSISWDGTNDRGEKAATGIHIILIETFDLKGMRTRYRLPIVVATKL